MPGVTRAERRWVFALGVAGLVPAALLTLLLVHQPSIGERRIYPMLRGSLTVVGLVLALSTVVALVLGATRFNRMTLSGLAWAAVTVVVCAGPLLESRPRARLYALTVDGEVEWTATRATRPALIEGDLVVSDAETGERVGLDPATGEERWRCPAAGPGECAPGRVDDVAAPFDVVEGAIEGGEDDISWALALPDETVEDIAWSGNAGYAYVSTSGADGGADGGAVVRFDIDDGEVQWRSALPATVTAHEGTAAIGVGGGLVVVAGGERLAALMVHDGVLRWSVSVVSLGKSRGYALPGAVQEVIVTASMVFLAATPQG